MPVHWYMAGCNRISGLTVIPSTPLMTAEMTAVEMHPVMMVPGAITTAPRQGRMAWTLNFGVD
jgi:hypothetical protein